MPEETGNAQSGAIIEGGIDAIIVGADVDGLAAAAYLGRAGLKTVLLEPSVEVGGAVRERELVPGLSYVDAEHLVYFLDPTVIADLDLYRHGVSYASRRLDSVYFFEDAKSLFVGGDLKTTAATFDDEHDVPEFQKFIDDAFDAAAFCRPAYELTPGKNGDGEKHMSTASPVLAKRLNFFAMGTAEDVLDAYLPDGSLKTAMISEAVFRGGAAPNEAFSFMNLVRRWAGETSGLQGAIAYPMGGAVTVVTALRRAAQAAKVDIRAATKVTSILIEKDRAAGVEIEGGGQLRAPIIVAAGDARRVFVDMVGAANIDIEFQRSLRGAGSGVSSAHLYLALKGAPRDEKTRENMSRRLVYAPPRDALRRAFADARAGLVPEDMIIEAIFPGVLDDNRDTDELQLLSVIAHPVPFGEPADTERRQEIEKAILANTEKFAPELKTRIKARDLRLPHDFAAVSLGDAASFASPASIIQQIARGRIAGAAGYIGGLYFCGPEMRIGTGLSCAAGRIAAKTAINDMKRGGRSS